MKLKINHGLLIIMATVASLSAAEDPGKSKFDSGKAVIDVSSYPEEIKSLYPLVKEKCGSCHSFARGVNAPYDADQWRRYVKRMMAKPDSPIDNESGKKIFMFLKYYSEHRK